MTRTPEISNLSGHERWRFTLSMSIHGVPSFSVIGLHTLYEVSGVLMAVCVELARRAWGDKSPDIVNELIRGGGRN